jgi:hypothetical protein
MTKPHEETWKLDEVIVMHNRLDGQKEAREVLGHAAPDMARALVAVLVPFHRRDRDAIADRELHTRECWDGIYAYLRTDGCPDSRCAAIRAALTKAGVLP